MLITVAIVKRRYSIMHRRSRRSSFLFSHRFSNLTCTRTRVYTEAMAKTRKNSDKRGKTDIKKKKNTTITFTPLLDLLVILFVFAIPHDSLRNPSQPLVPSLSIVERMMTTYR